MGLYTYRSYVSRRVTRYVVVLLALVVTFDFLSLLKHYRIFSNNLLANTVHTIDDLPVNVQSQKIFIVAQFWTSAVPLDEFWGQALLNLIQTLGAGNVFVSIYEGGSLDNTREVLRYLDTRLAEHGVERRIVLDPWSHGDEIRQGSVDDSGRARPGWVVPPEGTEKERRRIDFLAKYRNEAMLPLVEHWQRGRRWDKVLFLNDVMFKPAEVLTLLGTRQGNFSVACALDYHYPPAYYDTFALRDERGRGTLMTHFPYFWPGTAQAQLLLGEPVEVKSCWNGILAMDAEAFIARGVNQGLKFRATPDSLAAKHVEASECCLVHADMARMGRAERGIWVNPAVRVGYTRRAYDLTHAGSEKVFITATQYVTGVWKNRLDRWLKKREREIEKRVAKWVAEGATIGEPREEAGAFCLIDEMHLLIWNGWKHA